MLALAEAHLPAGGAFEVGAIERDLARAFDGFLSGEPEKNREDLALALLLVEYGPVVFERRWVTFSNLPLDQRTAHLTAWAESSMLMRRKVATAFRKFFSLVFFDHPSVWPAIGYPGPSLSAPARGPR